MTAQGRLQALPHPMPNVFQLHFDDASTSEIIVKAGEVKIHAHRIVSIAHSALFRAMLQSGTKENTADEVEMGQVEGPVLTAFISFMYGRLEDIQPDIALPLFVAADAHQANSHMCFCAVFTLPSSCY
ncbi:TPA: protein modification by small protein conjugation [Trebouxia sp. C0004]